MSELRAQAVAVIGGVACGSSWPTYLMAQESVAHFESLAWYFFPQCVITQRSAIFVEAIFCGSTFRDSQDVRGCYKPLDCNFRFTLRPSTSRHVLISLDLFFFCLIAFTLGIKITQVKNVALCLACKNKSQARGVAIKIH